MLVVGAEHLNCNTPGVRDFVEERVGPDFDGKKIGFEISQREIEFRKGMYLENDDFFPQLMEHFRDRGAEVFASDTMRYWGTTGAVSRSMMWFQERCAKAMMESEPPHLIVVPSMIGAFAAEAVRLCSDFAGSLSVHKNFVRDSAMAFEIFDKKLDALIVGSRHGYVLKQEWGDQVEFVLVQTKDKLMEELRNENLMQKFSSRPDEIHYM